MTRRAEDGDLIVTVHCWHPLTFGADPVEVCCWCSRDCPSSVPCRRPEHGEFKPKHYWSHRWVTGG